MTPKRPIKPPLELEDFGYDDAQILKADDPRPQLVPQYPVRNSQANSGRIATGSKTQARGVDRELRSSFDQSLREQGVQTAFLYVERGPGQGQLVPLSEGSLVLGRSSSADFRLQHPSISRRHAQLTSERGRIFLKDLESQNGTFVNRLRVTNEVEVAAGDQIALGTVLLKVRGDRYVTNPPSTVFEEDESTGFGGGSPVGVPKSWLLFGGSCLACLLIYILVGMLNSGHGDTAKPVESTPAAAAAKPAPPPEAKAAESAPPAPAPAKAPKSEVKPARATPAPSPSEEKPAPEQRPHRRGVHRAKALAPKAERAAPAAKEPPGTAGEDSLDPSSPSATAIRAKYEEGDLEAALALAREAHAQQWVSRLGRFKTEYDAARAALSGKDPDSASHHLQAALSLDEKIAEGWGTYNAELRSELTSLSSRNAPEGQNKAPNAKAKKSIDAAFEQ
jgi:pSer/pThr/pTyr-binding forkhead associated (FHA) protein